MRKIRIFEHTSLDGVIEHGQDSPHGDWTAPYRSPAGLAALLEAYGTRFDLLLGRRTYDLWAGFWPRAGSGPMADALNAATKYVATHRPEGLGWGPVRALGEDAMAGVHALRAAAGPDLIVSGSATLASPLLGQGLVDEVVLIVYPILLGRGKRILSDGAAPRALALVDTRATPTGVLLATYRCVG